MIEAALIFFGIAVFFIIAIVAFSILSRINDIKKTDEVEPSGDMVDTRNFLNKFGGE